MNVPASVKKHSSAEWSMNIPASVKKHSSHSVIMITHTKYMYMYIYIYIYVYIYIYIYILSKNLDAWEEFLRRRSVGGWSAASAVGIAGHFSLYYTILYFTILYYTIVVYYTILYYISPQAPVEGVPFSLTPVVGSHFFGAVWRLGSLVCNSLAGMALERWPTLDTAMS